MQETEIVINFDLHDKQADVEECQSRYRVLVAGRRFGKTTLAIVELVKAALFQNGAFLWYVAPSYRQAKMIAWKMLKEMLVKIFPVQDRPRFNESELSASFNNGSIIELRGADNEDSLRGVGLDGMVIDEFASIYDNWSVWHEVLRPALTDKRGWVLFIGTPKGKDSFYDLFLRGQRGDEGYTSWQFKTLDNPFIAEEEIEEAKENTPERYFRQEYEASFEDFVGLIYPEFGKAHIVEPFYIPNIYPKTGAIDPAISGTTGVLKSAIDEEGNVIIYAEYYKVDTRVSVVSEAIREDDVDWLIDPSSLRKDIVKEGKLYSLHDEYIDYDIRARTAESDVDSGINRVGEYFKNGRIKIFSTCKNLIWELERYHWAEQRESIKGKTRPLPFKSQDHLVDCLRYLIMARTSKADLALARTENPLSPWTKVAELKKRQEFRH